MAKLPRDPWESIKWFAAHETSIVLFKCIIINVENRILW